ncbi:aryl-alcohol dehydrogenase-like predicted oxidoreductase [Nocardia transvalensis]|uniref:Aryl-alcohol dehydrogenase-like predicted oxidoreductase n=2 Tax=Nocardia transvalensis TaxID=37333 RepID=A0A7W9UH34_9NOCA|nr:aldo/keto reductase [Nocardia transvalensis]MBB5912766.1 aryl-alcohol dehydrogenase-like predicted oxidoreductase [Nocardia transvalensis]
MSGIDPGVKSVAAAAGSDTEFVSLIRHAIDAGVTLFDTADVYGPHTNERLLGRAVTGNRDNIVLATKFGIYYDPDGYLRARGDSAYVRRSCDDSLSRLGVDHIDLYYLHRVDPDIPVEETWGTMADLVAAGKVRYLGMSEVSARTVHRAHSIHPVTALQSEWSLWHREIEPEIVPTCRRLGIGIVPFAPLGRGLLTGDITSADQLPVGDLRRSLPRFSEDNLNHNLAIVDALRAVAAEKSVTVAQLALAWVHHRGTDVVPIPGTRSLGHLKENIVATDLDLSADDLSRIEAASPPGAVAGARYSDRLIRYVGR